MEDQEPIETNELECVILKKTVKSSASRTASWSGPILFLQLVPATRLAQGAAQYGEPKLLAEIECRAKSAEGKVRHPFFKGLRDDI